MPKNQFVDFKAVKSPVSMERVLQHYGLSEKLKRSGDSLTEACPVEKNKEHDCESRSSTTRALSAEQASFPWVAQGARLLRQTTGRKDEEVGLLTSAELDQLPARAWLKFNRLYWDIESGLHERLDLSHNDDRCRIHLSPGLWVMGMFRRLSNRLFKVACAQKHPEHKTTTDFSIRHRGRTTQPNKFFGLYSHLFPRIPALNVRFRRSRFDVESTAASTVKLNNSFMNFPC